MALPKKNDKEKFLKNNRLNELFSKAERIDNNLWQVLQEIHIMNYLKITMLLPKGC